MALTPTTFKTLFPEFTAQADERVQLFLDQASRRIDPVALDTLADDAQSYLTAHLLAVAAAGASGASGPATSKTVGPLSVSFSSTLVDGSDSYSSTYYGREYQRLIKLSFPTPILAW